MKDVTKIVLTVVTTFLVTAALNFVLQYIFQEKGSIRIGPIVTIQRQAYMPIDISNVKKEVINDLILSIPASTNITNTISSAPIQMAVLPDSLSTVDRKSIKMSGIEPNQVTRLLIPMSNQKEVGFFKVVNARQVNLTVDPVDNISEPVITILKNSVFPVIIYATVLFLQSLWQLRKLNESDEAFQRKVEELNKQIQDTKVYIDKMEKQRDDALEQSRQLNQSVSAVKNDHQRIRILLLARISDYTKELDFWRDTIRKLLYHSTDRNIAADSIINQVTETLKTYGTRSGEAEEFETIKVLAALLSTSQNSKDGGSPSS